MALTSIVERYSLIQTAAFLVISYFFGLVIYRLYFHSLAKYPGPLFAKISVWPSFYHTVRGNRHIWLWRCQEIYGPTWRYRPDGVVINTPKGINSIYNSKANVKKGKYYEAWPRKVGAVNTWSVVDKQKHAYKRRVLSSAFSESAIRSAETFIIKHVDRWCDLLGDDGKEGWSQPKDMAEWSDYLVFDILGDLCFGKSFGIKEPGENRLRSLPKFMGSYMELLHRVASSPFLNMWLWLKPRGLDTLFESSVPEDLKAYAAFVESCLTERTKKEEQLEEEGSNKDARKDFFHYLFRAKDPETGELGYSPGELFSESELLIIAGSDTTSTVFAAAFFYLVHNPQAQSKLATEIRSTFESVDEIRNGKKLQSCMYLRAFIDESMRMNPPVTSELNREVLPGGLSINGEFFAEGTNVGVSLYSIHHNETYFPEPFAFLPERWIESEGATAESVALATSAFAPFSIGTRGCIGKNLAYMEMAIAIAKVMYRYDVRRVDQDTIGAGSPELGWGRRNKGEYQVNDAFVAAARHGPKVQFKASAH